MTKHYSPSTKGFYTPEIHGANMPADVVEITDEAWRSLLDAQSAGKSIQWGTGAPVAADRVVSAEEVTRQVRRQRNRLLAQSDWLVMRHREELEQGGKTTLTSAQYGGLQQWRQTLRDIPKAAGFPNVLLPASPVAIGSTS
jgi:Phage tail assembly chaperone protein